MSCSVAATAKVKHPNESIDFGLDLSNVLQTGETISAIGTITSSPSGDLAITNQAVNTATMFDDDGNPIPPGEAISLVISGGIDGKDYRITVDYTTKFGTAPGNTRTAVCVLEVRDGGV